MSLLDACLLLERELDFLAPSEGISDSEDSELFETEDVEANVCPDKPADRDRDDDSGTADDVGVDDIGVEVR